MPSVALSVVYFLTSQGCSETRATQLISWQRIFGLQMAYLLFKGEHLKYLPSGPTQAETLAFSSW